MRYFIEFSYNGKAYHGWQRQPDAITVQEKLEEGLSQLLQESIAVMGAGRTDSGVHAKQMFAHFDCDGIKDITMLTFKLNSFLPIDIAVHEIFEVNQDAHARFDAVSRSYKYRVATQKSPFNYDFAYYLKQPLDIDKMNEACLLLFNYIDFQCFSKSNTDVKTYNCKLTKAIWTKEENELVFTISADRFLRNMVRAIVGTMINIGLGKIEVSQLNSIIESKDRNKAGYSVPAKGLYLTEVVYPEHLRKKEHE
ncbi:MAG: tRNA pseudouridine(38-40) synthase TruA [Bacteroidetes bacterium MedPE-SWsnd-G2]|nr:MAG: tRNA pseudouridine(38-40) synthase TruA [Bacteroidetes bacterium MedPE-SWsnd-G2]